MSKNRISKYFSEDSLTLVSSTIPAGFVMVPSSLQPNVAMQSIAQQLHLQAFSLALKQSEEKFLAIMRSLERTPE